MGRNPKRSLPMRLALDALLGLELEETPLYANLLVDYDRARKRGD